MKRFLKKLFLAILLVFVLIQFYPRPAKNIDASISLSDLEKVHYVPKNAMLVLRTSCYDCHSNQTHYPWYSNIQPVSMWLYNHIRDGKEELNFSEFGSYSLRRQYHKLKEINDQIKRKKMPLKSYTFIHRDASLNDDQVLLLTNWTTTLIDSFKINYPPDSLVRKRN